MMTISPNSAAQFICERSGWSVTQLALQKILYLAHMVHLGRGHGPLVHGSFEAWDYGPVHPALYHKVKSFGSKPIPNVFWSQEAIGGTARDTLQEACDNLLHLSPGALVQNTHWKDGAWALNYSPSAKNILIPERDIIAEYQKRVGGKQAA